MTVRWRDPSTVRNDEDITAGHELTWLVAGRNLTPRREVCEILSVAFVLGLDALIRLSACRYHDGWRLGVSGHCIVLAASDRDTLVCAVLVFRNFILVKSSRGCWQRLIFDNGVGGRGRWRFEFIIGQSHVAERLRNWSFIERRERHDIHLLGLLLRTCTTCQMVYRE